MKAMNFQKVNSKEDWFLKSGKELKPRYRISIQSRANPLSKHFLSVQTGVTILQLSVDFRYSEHQRAIWIQHTDRENAI